MIAYIPSPSTSELALGPFHVHFYGLVIAVAVVVAAWLAQKRWARLGGWPNSLVPIIFWAVVAGLVGARAYSLATSWQIDTGGSLVQAFEIWDGGLGIWGAVAGGFLGAWLAARHYRIPLRPLMDTTAPCLALAQAIGRWGNYFNQELFGLPSKLPWAVRITNQAQLASLPQRYQPPLGPRGTFLAGTYQPTFLYESVWDLVTFGLLLVVERRLRLRRGYLFAAYAALYTFGRFFTEYLRIDPAHRILGLRLNDWTAVAVFVAAAGLLAWKGRAQPGDDLVGMPLPAEVIEAERGRAAQKSGTGPSGPAPRADGDAGPESEVADRESSLKSAP